MRAHRGSREDTGGEGSRLQVEERGLSRNRPCQHLILDFQPQHREDTFPAVSAPRLWCSVKAAGNTLTQCFGFLVGEPHPTVWAHDILLVHTPGIWVVSTLWYPRIGLLGAYVYELRVEVGGVGFHFSWMSPGISAGGSTQAGFSSTHLPSDHGSFRPGVRGQSREPDLTPSGIPRPRCQPQVTSACCDRL